MTIWRIRLLTTSATYKLAPDVSIVIPFGKLNDAAVPTPSTYAAVPEPATVDTDPVEMTILRIR